MTDHQRADVTLPEHRCISPNLDKLAEEGVAFTQAYTPMAHCCPARASFFSGLMPSRHGVWNNVNNAYAINRGPYDDVRMFSEDLRDAGYDMRYTGKWHVSALGRQTPARYGWKEMMQYDEVLLDQSEIWEKVRANSETEDVQGVNVVGAPGYNFSNICNEKEDAKSMDRETVEIALDALDEITARDDPWCLYVGFVSPHSPYDADKEFLDLYDLDSIKLPESYYDEMEDKPEYYRKVRKNYESLGEKGTRDAIRHFWALCTKIDRWFGMLMEKLEESGEKDNTVVIFCSDHGDYLGEHGLFQKQVPAFLGAYKIPVIMSWPSGIRNPGRRESSLVSLTDFAPTFLEIASEKTDQYFSGNSLMPFLKNEKPESWRREICTQCEGTEQLFTQRMVITHKYKYVYNGFGKDEFYDLENDPHEIVNQISNPEYKDKMENLVMKMWLHAYQEQDRLGSVQSLNVNTAPFGPKEAFRRAKRLGINIPKPFPNPNISK